MHQCRSTWKIRCSFIFTSTIVTIVDDVNMLLPQIKKSKSWHIFHMVTKQCLFPWQQQWKWSMRCTWHTANSTVRDLNHPYLRCTVANGCGGGRGHDALTLSWAADFLHVSTASIWDWGMIAESPEGDTHKIYFYFLMCLFVQRQDDKTSMRSDIYTRKTIKSQAKYIYLHRHTAVYSFITTTKRENYTVAISACTLFNMQSEIKFKIYFKVSVVRYT